MDSTRKREKQTVKVDCENQSPIFLSTIAFESIG